MLLGLVMATLGIMPFSIKGKYIGEDINLTQNKYVISQDMYLVANQDSINDADTIVIRRRLKIAMNSKDKWVFVDNGIFDRCFLEEDSVYDITLSPISQGLLSEVPQNEVFYYKHNCVFPESNDNRFYEIRSDSMGPTPYFAPFNMYVDVDNRLYKILELTPKCGCQEKVGKYIEIPYPYYEAIGNKIDSMDCKQ